ncbi:D-alanyl-D-alanine carboxypeptidase [Hathewaya proteolytica DSM 3090]|uniref:D-alanyl-D-alanine carboxypeptidase n=1 Tax=Hathewaya proteolytica DSM 3090 TaxID=1121331 RepID=A0A1M6LGJ4_9CLOT|nr:D-alanyl-D-alanine carboxypeptidase family protein [Hathewaya proteolytica]SHJ70331.1 D-alanyl-D-alanine carboxypeptidase [Hathewaya proteolytica DSM 3090]
MGKKLSALLITLNLIFCNTTLALADTKEKKDDLDLKATSAISYDLDDKSIIYAKNIDTKNYPASITKLLTALVFSENKKEEDMLSYTKSAYDQPPYSYRLNLHPVNIGDKMSAKDAMDGLLLYSGNDIAYMIADNVTGDTNSFLDAMNKKAKELNMNNSRFETPNGIDDNSNNMYTTAYDLTKLMSACYKDEWIKGSMAKKTSTIGFLGGNKANVENRNKLINIDGCIGGKTGYTSKAGRCLVALYERNNRKIVGVVLNSEYNFPKDTVVFEDMNKLINYSYKAKKQIVYKKGSKVGTTSVKYKAIPFLGPEKTMEIPVYVNQDIAYFNKDLPMTNKFNYNTINPFRFSSEDAIGTITVSQKDDSKQFKLYSEVTFKSVLKDNWMIYTLAILSLVAIITTIVWTINSIRRRSKRHYY